ncbi:MAG: M28 family peptidase [Coriobacteriia bacterium]|nr:M28 family peptidase [Coriobacteriia bacterium]
MDDPARDATARVAEHLRLLTTFPDRHVGGEGNRAATSLFADEMASLGLDVRRVPMTCVEWVPGSAWLEVGGQHPAVHVGPYSLPCELEAPFVAVSSIEELESEVVRGAVVLLHGQVATGQVMPRNFTFYNPDSHRRVYQALDTFAPAAVVAATGRDPEMVGSQYPFPLFEDGDLDIPNAYITDVEGAQLVALGETRARLRIASQRLPATAEHVVATLPGTGDGRIVVTAHIDSRRGSPGALDNATGVATLLEVARLLSEDYAGEAAIEFVPFNGEDDYANPGELQWIAENDGRFGEIALGINIDDSSQHDAVNHVSFYGCPEGVEGAVRSAMGPYPEIAEGPQWFQGDHAILGIYGRPAIAVASAEMMSFMANYAHTEGDVLELADPALVARTAAFIADVVRHVSPLA